MEREPNWDDVRVRINGLWPRYEPTDTERQLISDRLSRLNARWLLAAVDSYRCDTASGVFRIAELLEHYRRIANTGAERAAVAKASPAATRADDERRVASDHTAAIRTLRAAPRDHVAAVVRELRGRGWITDAQLPARVEDWRRSTCMMVCAAYESRYNGHAASDGRNVAERVHA
jgi:hypothetical protein